MKIALIGLGDIAVKAHLPVLSQISEVEWVLCTRNVGTLTQLAARFRISEYYTDYRDLIRCGIDAVMIHSATSSHFELASYFLKQGMPVFVDKPLADNFADCEALHDLAESQQQPLFMGFNRRYIPLYCQELPGYALPGTAVCHAEASSLRALRWEKHRYNLTGEPRTFIYDDFIHPLDSVNLHADLKADDLMVTTQFDVNQAGASSMRLARVDVQWQRNNTLFQASMNRQHGMTCEHISADYQNMSFRFESFTEGRCWREGAERTVRQPDWTPMLASKGFEAMAHHWLTVAEQGKQPLAITQRNLHSHWLAEQVLRKVQPSL